MPTQCTKCNDEGCELEDYRVISVSPTELYPVTKLELCDPQTLQRAIDKMKNNNDPVTIRGIEYKGNIYILDGQCEMLAANILDKTAVTVELLDRKQIPFWCSDKTLQETLRTLGTSTLHDFEAVGRFTYEKYPLEYRRT